MKLEGTIHCEGPGCDRHSHVGAANMDQGRLPIGFLRVTWYDDTGDEEFAFCGTDCAMRWMATFPPAEVIPVSEEGNEHGE